MRFCSALFLLALPIAAQEIRTTQIASGIPLPSGIENAGDGSGRLFFVQQNGIIRVFRNGALVQQPFLDIRTKTTGSGERGLLGLAFPPGYAQKQRFYVDYTNLRGDTVIAQYRTTSNPDVADPASETILLTIPQPFENHNGGQVRFGPDGYLYVGMGDGGSGGDPQKNGQNLNALLGKILRIDVENSPGTIVIPPSNPFVNTAGARPEIWALGMRNPWRFSFDRATGDLWIADVGQETYEEINFQPAASRGGENYGWNIMEGMHCFGTAICSTANFTLPVWEYTHASGCSISGGFMYRGNGSPGLRGLFLYADYCSGTIWALDHAGGKWSSRILLSSGFGVTTFGEDEAGELYIANQTNGTIHRIDGPTAPRVVDGAVVNAASFAAGVSPGSLATLFGAGLLNDTGIVMSERRPGSTSLGGVSVTVNGTAVPVLAVANVHGQEQVNFQVPFELSGTTAQVAVSRQDQSSAALTVPVLRLQPAIYTLDGTQAIVVHNDGYRLVTADDPLERGEFAFLYAGGLGPVTNQPANGSGGPLSPLAAATASVSAGLGLSEAESVMAILAPGFVGVYQVNFRVPPGAASGMQPLVIRADGVASPVVRVPVR